MGYVYLLHFDRPIAPGHPTQHYIGYASDLAHRIQAHARGRYNGGGNGCARLCEVAKERGIGFTVARLWLGDRPLERRLKLRKNARRLCPICGQAVAVGYAEEVPAEGIDTLLTGVWIR